MAGRIARIAASILFLASSLAASAAALDPAFGTGGKRAVDLNPADSPAGLLVQPDGRIAFGDAGGPVSGPLYVGRLDASGAPDAAFGTGGNVRFDPGYAQAAALARAGDGSLFLAGRWYEEPLAPCFQGLCPPPVLHPFLGKVSASGVEDRTFDANAKAALGPYTASPLIAVDVQADGKVLALGQKHLFRIKTDGTLDIAVDLQAEGLSPQPDGLMGRSVLAQADGTIVIGRYASALGFVRLNANGTVAQQGNYTFQAPLPPVPGALVSPPALFFGPITTGGFALQQPDGKIVVAGSTATSIMVVRFLQDGTLDTTFGEGGVIETSVIVNSVVPDPIRSFALAPDGGFVFLTAGSEIIRLYANGFPDSTFGNGGRFIVDAGSPADARSVAVQADGKIVVLSQVGLGSRLDAVVARIDPAIVPAVSVTSGDFVNSTWVDLGPQSARTTSESRFVIVANKSASAVSIDSVTEPVGFFATNGCGATLAAGASCTIAVVASGVGLPDAPTGTITGALTVTASGVPASVGLRTFIEPSLITHFYRSILRREPDVQGKAYWGSVADTLGHNYGARSETWYAMASQFFGSAEYTNQNRTDVQFIEDLYNTFFDRPADSDGLAFWQSQLAAGLTRDMLMTSFTFSDEFQQAVLRMPRVTGDPDEPHGVADVAVVMDFYRGLLGRVPDTAGLDYWLQQLRVAECQGSMAANQAAATATADRMSQAFLGSVEYAARARTDSQFLGDLYNAFLRRGADVGGFNYWLGQLQSNAITREQLRQMFNASQEFSNRVGSVASSTCIAQ